LLHISGHRFIAAETNGNATSAKRDCGSSSEPLAAELS